MNSLLINWIFIRTVSSAIYTCATVRVIRRCTEGQRHCVLRVGNAMAYGSGKFTEVGNRIVTSNGHLANNGPWSTFVNWEL